MTRTWKVGEVARSAGVTVRTLHHWDSIGLLHASSRSSGGHREYTDDDLGRLYLVLVLRDLGLGLSAIRTTLGGRVPARQLLGDHLLDLEESLAALMRLRDLVGRVVEGLDRADDALPAETDAATDAGTDDGTDAEAVDPLLLLRAMHASRARAGSLLSRHLTGSELGQLQSAAADVGSALPFLVEVQWPQLYRRAEQLRDAGIDPGDPAAQDVASRMEELSALVTARSPQLSAGVRAAWRDDPAAMAGVDDATAATWAATAEFVDRARTIHAHRHRKEPS